MPGSVAVRGAINLNLQHSALLPEAPRYQRAAPVADADASVLGQLLRSLGCAMLLQIDRRLEAFVEGEHRHDPQALEPD